MPSDDPGRPRGNPAGAMEASRGAPIGRIVVVHRERSIVATESGEFVAELSGRLRYATAQDPDAPRPTVGDRVSLDPRTGDDRATIRAILPRRTQLVRKQAGRTSATQVVAANVDVALIVAALDGPVNLRRLERYIALSWSGGVQPVVVLSKADLCPDPAPILDRLGALAGVPIHVLSAAAGTGLDELTTYFGEDRTVVLLGPSGVGKSTLINGLLGADRQAVQPVRGDGKGRHTTTRRELIARPGGGFLIDTPGLRELQPADEDGIDATFGDVEALAGSCRFADCTHRAEPGCAVRDAIEAGDLDDARLAAYTKLQRETRYQEARHDQHAQLERKREERRLHRGLYRWLGHKRGRA